MAKNRKQLIHLHTPDAKMPEQGLLNLGEIAVQHNNDEAALYIEKTNGKIAKFIDATAVDAKIKVENLRAETAEGTLDGKIESLTSAVTDNEKVVATALNQIVKSVGLDENGNSPLPQNISLTDAIKDVTNKVGTLESSNHTHANKAVLDGITTEKVNAWNSAKADAISSAKTYADSLNTAMDSRVDALEASSHSHDNKTVLDGITDVKVAAWDAAEANAKAYVDGKVNGKFDDKGAAAQALKDAKSYADGLAVNYDASGAAAQALKDAKSYADGLNTAMDSRVDVLETSSHTHGNKSVLDGITSKKVAAWDAAKADAISSAKTYTDSAITALNLASTYETKGTAQNLINGLKLPETYAKKEVESTISTLVGKDTGKSVRSVSAEEVAKIVNSADTRYDTLKEIADWIISDTTGSAQMANDISALKAISAGTRLDTLESKSHTLESKSHTHKNKNLLDTYTQTESNLADAVAKKHEHTNKAVLDGINANKVAAWDAAEGNAKAYVNGKVDGKFDDKGAAAQALKDAKTYADGKADKVHTHAIADVTGLQGALDGKAASAHTHAIADVTGLQDALDGKDPQGAAAQALVDAKAYTDEKLIKIDCGIY